MDETMFDNVLVRFDLGCKVLPGNLVAGKFDDSGFSIVAVAASGDKLIIHNEYNQQPLSGYFNRRLEVSLGGNSSINYLSITDIVKSLLILTLTDLEPNNAFSAPNEQQVPANLSEDPESVAKTETRDILVVGCISTLLVYDVKINCDLFYKRVTAPISCFAELQAYEKGAPDNSKTFACGTSNGILSLQINQFSERDNNLVITTTGDKIQTMITGCLANRTILVTGSEEGKIIGYDVTFNGKQRVYTNKMFIEETSSILCLCAIPTMTVMATSSEMNGQQTFSDDDSLDHLAYGTKNEVIGTFRLICTEDSISNQFSIQVERLWRIKIKDIPLSIVLYDIDGDGLDELIIGCRNGKIEVRSVFTGEIKHKMRLEKNVKLAGMCVADYCQDGFDLLLVCTTEGTILGYRPRDMLPRQKLVNYNASRLNFPRRTLGSHIVQHNLKKNTTEVADENGFIDDHNDDSLENQIDLPFAIKCSEVQSNALLRTLMSKLKYKEKLACQMRSAQDDEYLSGFHRGIFNKGDMDLILDAEVIRQKICIDWKFDIQSCALILTLSIRTKTSGFKLLLMRDERMNLFSGGYMIAIPPESIKSDTAKLNELTTMIRAKDDIECELDVTTIIESSISPNAQIPDRVINKKILVPAFSMYALFPINQEWPKKDMPNVTINLPSISHQKVWQWMEMKFLCLQVLSKSTQEELNHYLSNILSLENTVELRLLDLRIKPIDKIGTTSTQTQDKTFLSDLPLARIRFSSSTYNLLIESESKKFLANVVRSLVIEWLHMDKYSSRANIGFIQAELGEKTLLAKQYDETDNKILAEFSETSKNLENLIEQLDIANSLCE